MHRVEGLGGRVVYYELPPSEAWAVTQLRQWLPRDYFGSLEVVDLHGKMDATDAKVRRFQTLSRLRLLILDDTPVSDAGLVHLQKPKRLRCIWLRNTKVTDQGFAPVARSGFVACPPRNSAFFAPQRDTQRKAEHHSEFAEFHRG